MLTPFKAVRKKLFIGDGLLACDWKGGGNLPVYYRGSGHALTVAPTGSGKGATALIPNALRYPFLFLVDVGGETSAVAVKAWRRRGYDFAALNPWGLHAGEPWSLPSQGFNPVATLDPTSSTFASDADLLAEMLVTRTGGESGNSAYFKDEAQSVFAALLMHIRTAEPAHRQNLLTLREYVTSGPDQWEALLAALAANTATPKIREESAALLRRETQAPKELSAILSTMKQDTNWISDPVLASTLAANDFDLAPLKGRDASGKKLRGCVRSVIIPLEYIETHAALARLVIASAIWTMQRGKVARRRVLFVLDEFPALKRMNRIAGGLATLRKYRVWLWLVCQNVGQLRDLYGPGWENIVSNCGLRQFFGAWDVDTATYVSRLCGRATIRTIAGGEASRELVMPDEVMTLADGEQIVLMDNLRPIRGKARPYWERVSLRGQFLPNPFHGSTPSLPLATAPRVAWAAGYRFLAWLLGPSPALVATALAAATVWADPHVYSDASPHGANRPWEPEYCLYETLNGPRHHRFWGRCPSFFLTFGRR
jgi:type IV secretion system protein VirD4